MLLSTRSTFTASGAFIRSLVPISHPRLFGTGFLVLPPFSASGGAAPSFAWRSGLPTLSSLSLRRQQRTKKSSPHFVCNCWYSAQAKKFEYIHPLSQIVLEHLQSTRRDWVQQKGLDEGLTLMQPDGTFELRFPSYDNDGARIWTSYDREEKKHWLIVHKGDVVGRYMLQDNLKPAWHSDSRSTPERICDAVDAMIDRIDKNDKARS